MYSDQVEQPATHATSQLKAWQWRESRDTEVKNKRAFDLLLFVWEGVKEISAGG